MRDDPKRLAGPPAPAVPGPVPPLALVSAPVLPLAPTLPLSPRKVEATNRGNPYVDLVEYGLPAHIETSELDVIVLREV